METSSKDLSRRELLSYIFTDFFRISYDVLAIFFDALVVPEIYLLTPRIPVYSTIVARYLGPAFTFYMWGVVAVLEAGVIWLQVLAYRRLWPKYYTMKKGRRK